jgi:ADP-ribose pyrophosphatase
MPKILNPNLVFSMHLTHRLVERTLESRLVFDGMLLNVNKDRARMPDGSESVREWIRHPGACAVVPIYENGDIILLRQFRYPVKQIFLEVPAGKIDQPEPPDLTATRELEEETGVRCDELHYIGHFYPGIGYADEVIHIYAATSLSDSPAHTDPDEFVEPFRIPFTEALEMVHNGIINDGKTVICLLRTWHWYQQRQT